MTRPDELDDPIRRLQRPPSVDSIVDYLAILADDPEAEGLLDMALQLEGLVP